MTRTKTMLIVAVALLVGAMAAAGIGTALAWGSGPGGPWWGSFGGMMGGNGGGMVGGSMMGGNGGGMVGGGMMGGSGMMDGGMMGGWSGQAAPNQGTPIPLDKAVQAVQSYVERTGNKDLSVDELMEFENNFYAIVKERSTGSGAFELLVDKYTGNVFPEYGPNMMWNAKYGMMGGQAGMMGGMMGSQPTGEPTVTAEKAEELGQAWLDKYQPGSTTGQSDRFYGYYTLHTEKNGKITGMLSVNVHTGQVWYHTWHRDFVQMKELDL